PCAAMTRAGGVGIVTVIRFAAAARVRGLSLLWAISFYGWGRRVAGKTVMRGDDDLDRSLAAVCADIGYVKSKWVMEKLADAARARRVGELLHHPFALHVADVGAHGRETPVEVVVPAHHGLARDPAPPAIERDRPQQRQPPHARRGGEPDHGHDPDAAGARHRRTR
ncbi:hypothetical protein, partial [Burkholderia pseudomallei]|uniref:hypothetical protein n=1 Tax=Burkholderia pseudomallei TaxID=28450 RepID=UPI0021564C19